MAATGSNRERILTAAKRLFNRDGVHATSTNHVARHLGISPGNLYFHFCHREEILRALFAEMREEIVEFWEPVAAGTDPMDPAAFFAELFKIFWRYRFFHREMYAIRRRDARLAKTWHQHIAECLALFERTWAQWLARGLLTRDLPAGEKRRVLGNVLVVASTSLQFYESGARQPGRHVLQEASAQVLCALSPYMSRPPSPAS